MAVAERGFDPRTFALRAQQANRCAAPLAGRPERTDRLTDDVSKRVASASPSEEEQPKADRPQRASRAAPVLLKPYAGNLRRSDEIRRSRRGLFRLFNCCLNSLNSLNG
jgi:hypothetical protein